MAGESMNAAMLAQVLGVTSGAAPLAGGALSLIQLLQGMNQQKKAQGMFPQIPPQLRMLQDEYRRKARNAEVGSGYMNTINAARNLGATSAQAVLQTGNPMAYNFAMRSAGGMLNDLLANVQNKQMAYEDKAAAMTNKIADMQYASDANKYTNAMAQGVENQRFGMNNLAQFLTYMGMPKNAPAGGMTEKDRQGIISGIIGRPQQTVAPTAQLPTGLPPTPRYRPTTPTVSSYLNF